MSHTLAALAGAVIWIIAFIATQVWLDSRKPKTAPHYAVLEAKPGGVVLDLVSEDGETLRASLVLDKINWRMNGSTTAEFVDRSYWLERNRFRG